MSGKKKGEQERRKGKGAKEEIAQNSGAATKSKRPGCVSYRHEGKQTRGLVTEPLVFAFDG